MTRIGTEAIVKLEWVANALRKEGLNVREIWLVVPPELSSSSAKAVKDASRRGLKLKVLQEGRLADVPLDAEKSNHSRGRA